ncbi:histidine phosphatase superfamily (branch 2) domain-containing protein [Phthorimaea operculella]|nr:histidine phosphatase superfamily (branch 2) domain-containing protein [Phthorimaea operculella]
MPPPMPEYPRLQAQPRYERLPSGYYRTPAMAFMGRPPTSRSGTHTQVWVARGYPAGRGLTAFRFPLGNRRLLISFGPVQSRYFCQRLRFGYGDTVAGPFKGAAEVLGVEEPPTADRRKPEDDECELFYQYNTARCPSGRFVTRLPFLPNRPALGWIKRFVNNCRKPQAERNFTPVLSPAERNAALCSLVRVVQAEHFEEEVNHFNLSYSVYYSLALDGKVERDSEGKEIRYPVILSNQEKLISRKVCLAFKQTECGFDLLRAAGRGLQRCLVLKSADYRDLTTGEEALTWISACRAAGRGLQRCLVLKSADYRDLTTGEEALTWISVERDSEGKEIRYPVILSNQEKLISRKVCLAFKQTVCGFDLLRANGKSFVCDVNGFSFVKNSNKYYDDCAKILGNMILRELAPTLHIPWSVPFQLDDPPIVPTTFGKMMELRCVVAVIRHGDRTPKQKMKVEVRHPRFFEIFEKYEGFKRGHVKLKKPKQLQEILDIARGLLADIHTRHADPEIEEKQGKLEQLKSVLEMYGHFSGINRKVQMKYQPRGRPRGSSSDDVGGAGEPSLVLILKWGGELTPAGRIQAEELGRMFRCMYPGGQGRHIPGEGGTQGLGLLRLHSTFRHDLKIYASDEGRVQMTAAAFAKGLLALEGELTPILVQMVKSANTNGLLDNDCDSSKVQNMAKARLHEAMQVDRDFTEEDRARINPCRSLSISAAMDFVKNPVRCCAHVHTLIQQLAKVVSTKRQDSKTKDTILYHGETWELMGRRWGKIEKDFCTKNKTYDISKIPDIYDCIKYDLQHNQHTLQFDLAEELYIYAKYLADIVIPQEYGLTMQEKLTIGQGICTPLLKKIRADLQRNIEESGEETVNRLNPRYSHGVSSPGRHVRTRLYFTSESHVHSLLTVLRFGGLLDILKDEQWRRAMEYVSMVSELNYMSQIVVMLYEDPTKDPCSEERFHVELHFSPGVNCCVQKNLPPGPGFRPHSRNHSTTNNSSSSDEVKCIEEEGEDDQMASQETLQPDGDDLDTFSPTKAKSKLRPSDPIPICNLHYTVSGHEASTLAARLNAELRARSHTCDDTSDHVQCEEKEACKDPEEPQPRARSYDQHKQTPDNDAESDDSLSTVVELRYNSLRRVDQGRRQRHSIAGQMSYLKMLGLGARGKLPGAAGLFSTAVISGSSSAPNLRVCIPSTASSNTALEGFCGVPAIRPLETLHNALSLRQLDAFLERVTAAPVVLGSPPAPAPAPQGKPPSPTNSVGWSGPSSLMSSSGELPSGLSSAGPSSPNSNYASNSDTKNNTSECSAWGVPAQKLPQWEGEGATLTALDHHMHRNVAGSSISGSVTPVSLASELEFNSNEATAGSITDQDLMSAEGEDDEETLSVDPCGSPVRVIKNDLSPQPTDSSQTLDYCQPSTSSSHFYGLDLQQTKENLCKDMPSSSKNFNLDFDVDSKCRKEPPLHLNLDKFKRDEILNNDRRFSDSSSLKNNLSQGSRFKTTLVVEDSLRPESSSEISDIE